MLRVGLTGDLGSGKTTVAEMLRERGAVVLSSDDMGRAMMRPGEAVYAAIVEHFGADVVAVDGTLDRRELARLAFGDSGRVGELNAIVHPAVIAAQKAAIEAEVAARPRAIVVVESALIFTTTHAGEEPWSSRFDCVVWMTTPEELSLERYVRRVQAGAAWSAEQVEAARVDARRRLRLQKPAEAYQKNCIVVANDGNSEDLALRVEALWGLLTRLECATRP